MTNSASVTLVTPKELEQLFRKHGDLKTGDRLEARVLKVKPDGKARVDFGKFKADVDLKVPVKEGDVVRLVVVEKAKQLKLKVEHVKPRTKPPPPQQAQGGEVKQAVKQADVRQERAIDDLRTRIDRLIRKTGKAPASPEESKQVDARAKDLSRELVKVKEQLHSTQTGEALAKEMKQGAENLLDNAVNALRQVSKTGGNAGEAAQKMEALATAVRDLRTALNSGQEFRELRDAIVQEIKRLQETVEASDIPLGKEVRQTLAGLAAAADKIAELKQPDQQPQLQHIISEEIKPHLSRLHDVLEDEVVIQGSDKHRLVVDLSRRAENIEQVIDVALQRLPPPTHNPPLEVAEVLKELDLSVTKLADLPEGASLPRYRQAPPMPPAPQAAPEAPPPETPVPPERFFPDVSTARTEMRTEATRAQESAQPAENSQPVPSHIKEGMEAAFQRVETVLRETTRNENVETSQRLENLFQAVRNFRISIDNNRDLQELRDTIVKEVSRLKEQLENVHLPPEAKKELQDAIAKLSEAADKISELKRPDQLPELRKVIAEEIRPGLQDVRRVLEKHSEAAVQTETPEVQKQQYEAVRQQVESLEREIDLTLRKPPVPPKELDVYLKAVEQAVERVEAASQGEVAPAHDTEMLRSEISREAVHTREHIFLTEDRQPVPPEIKTEADAILKRVESSLQNIPETGRVETSQRLENLFRAVRHFRVSVENNRDIQELRDTIVKEVSRLNELVEKVHLPPDVKKEVQDAIVKLSEAADKISELKRPDQLPELRKVIAEEIQPGLKDVRQVLEKHSDAAVQTETPDQQKQQYEAIQQQVRNLEREIDISLRRPPVPPKEMNLHLQEVERALNHVVREPPVQATAEAETAVARPEPAAPEVPRFSESIQDIYNNVKAALRLLQSRLQAAEGQVELPEEIRQVFRELQSDLNVSEAADRLLKQLTQLKTLVERAGLPQDKLVQETLNSLEQLMTRLLQLKRSHRFEDLQHFIRKELQPTLNVLGEIFKDPAVMEKVFEPTKLAGIMEAVRSLQSGSERVLSAAIEKPLELSQLSDLSQRLVSLPKTMQGAEQAVNPRASENIANIAHSIEELLARFPENAPGTGSTGEAAMPAKIRSLLSTVKAHLEPLDIGDSALKLVPRLKSLVKDSGVFFEKKLGDTIARLTEASDRIRGIETLEQLPQLRSIIENDMKPNLLQLRDLLDDRQLVRQLQQLGEAHTLDTIRDAVEELLSNIGSQQDRALEGRQSQNPVQMFSFHLPIKDEEPAELKVFYNRGREKDSPDEYKLSLFLEMSRLGEVRTDFYHLQDELNISFYVKDDKVKDHLEDHLFEIQEVLEPLFPNLNVNVLVSREKIADFDTAGHETEAQFISDKAVNVKV